jgi:hypothetical protein
MSPDKQQWRGDGEGRRKDNVEEMVMVINKWHNVYIEMIMVVITWFYERHVMIWGLILNL